MTDAPRLGSGSLLNFMSPISDQRADAIVSALAAESPATIADYGCGWGELLLRLLAAAPEATGIGVDVHGPDIARARANAERRGLDDRATFVEGPATDVDGTADVILSIGAYHAFGGIPEALAALLDRLNPGGRLLFGVEFWERVPDADRLAKMWPGMSVDDCMELGDIADLAVAAGFRPLSIQVSGVDEWDVFESGNSADVERWLLANPGHPESGQLRGKLDQQRDRWLRGTRGYFGFAFFMLGAPGN